MGLRKGQEVGYSARLGTRKLTNDQVREARARYHRQQPRVSIRSLAEEYGIGYTTMFWIIKRRHYQEVE